MEFTEPSENSEHGMQQWTADTSPDPLPAISDATPRDSAHMSGVEFTLKDGAGVRLPLADAAQLRGAADEPWETPGSPSLVVTSLPPGTELLAGTRL